MNKYELELQLQKIAVDAKKHASIMGLLSHLITMVAIIACIYVIVNGLQVIVAAQPEAITALANVVEKFNINSIIGYIASALLGLGWIYERKGKKRAIRQNGEMRRTIESNDKYHPSSELDANGDPPK